MLSPVRILNYAGARIRTWELTKRQDSESCAFNHLATPAEQNHFHHKSRIYECPENLHFRGYKKL